MFNLFGNIKLPRRLVWNQFGEHRKPIFDGSVISTATDLLQKNHFSFRKKFPK